MRCSWSGWTTRQNDVLNEYRYQELGPGEPDVVLQVICTLEQAKAAKAVLGLFRRPSTTVHTFVNLLIKPRISDAEVHLIGILDSEESDASSGFMPLRTSPVAGNASIINITDPAHALETLALLKKEEDCVLRLFANPKEEILRLPIPVPLGFVEQWRGLADRI